MSGRLAELKHFIFLFNFGVLAPVDQISRTYLHFVHSRS